MASPAQAFIVRDECELLRVGKAVIASEAAGHPRPFQPAFVVFAFGSAEKRAAAPRTAIVTVHFLGGLGDSNKCGACGTFNFAGPTRVLGRVFVSAHST